MRPNGAVGPAAEPVLQVEDFAVYYDTPRGPVKAVDGVTFALRAGERLGLIGESGSGKTTMGTALLRLNRPPARIVRGRVLLNGRDLLAVPERELARMRLGEIALVPQGAMNALNPVMRIRDQIEDGLLAHGQLPKRELAERVAHALARVGLPPELADRYPHELSGGQQQRVGLCRAMMLKPRILLLDEPFGSLDPITRKEIHEEFLRLRQSEPCTTVLVTHDLAEALRLGQRLVVLHQGVVEQEGEPEEVSRKPATAFVRTFFESQLAAETVP